MRKKRYRKERRGIVRARLFSLVMVLLMTAGLSLPVDALTVDATYRDGAYDGTGQGRNGAITVRVTVREGELSDIRVLSQRETAAYWEKAVAVVEEMLRKNSTDVDAISGATLSSHGIRTAVEQALRQALPEDPSDPQDPGSGRTEIDPSIFASGDGSTEHPYSIVTVDQLKAFAGSLSTEVDYREACVRLDADLDLSGENWKPIGGSFYPFQGTFDGGNYTLSGLTEGSAEAPLTLDGNNAYIGLFGRLGEHAVIRDVRLEAVSVHTRSAGSAYLGGIAAQMRGSDTEGDYRGARIDHCSVSGVMEHRTAAGTTFVGGVSGHVFKGAIINCMTDVDLTCVEESGQLAEAGGLAGLNNRGLIANSCALGDITASGYRDTQYDIEGMACIGSLAAVNGGSIVNCYGAGNVTAMEYSTYTGLLAGWVTGIGKVYRCWYQEDAEMHIDGRRVVPVDPFGDVVPSGVSDEWGWAYTGGLTDGIRSFRFEPGDAETVTRELNASFSAFPVDIAAVYGLQPDCLRTWKAEGDRAVLTDDTDTVTYVRPAVEKQETKTSVLKDGVWHGRSEDRTSVVRMTVEDGRIVKTEAISGEREGAAWDEAVARAGWKAVYGDDTDYSQADPSCFQGSGTEEDPYRIETEEQLRCLSESIDEDVDWEGIYFQQTADITLRDGEWRPIGWGIYGEVDGYSELVAFYPFRGNYDGGNHAIRNLRIGSAEHPAETSWAGLFGVIQGSYETNTIPEGDVRVVSLRNIRLEDVGFYTENRFRNYIGGLVGNAQGGFILDNCSVTGTMVSRSSDDFAFSGGLAGSLMYGLVSDCRTEVDVTAYSGANYSYTAGMAAVTNRATIINSYALGDVHGDAGQTSRAEAGGFVGLDGGICVNCYARGNVEVLSKYSMYLGGFAGMAASSSEHRYCYFNKDAEQKIAGERVEETRYAGKVVNESVTAAEQAKGLAEMSSEPFRDLLEQNRKSIGKTMAEIGVLMGADERGSSRYHSVYYMGDGEDLNAWRLEELTVGFFLDHAEICPSGRFVDLDPSLWYHEGTDFVIRSGMMQGIGEALFDPDGTASRAMLVTILHRMEGTPPAEPSAFEDVPAGSWYEAAVDWAADRGIVLGMDAKTFAPDDALTREQIAVMLCRYAAATGRDVSETADLSRFEDVSAVSVWAEGGMGWAVRTGLIRGMTESTLAPGEPATRAQLAVMMHRCHSAIA